MNTRFSAPAPVRGVIVHASVLAALLVPFIGCASQPPEVARAKALFDQREYDQAHAAALEAEKSSPWHPVARRVVIRSSYSLGLADRALAEYREWYEHRGDHDRALLERLALTTLWQALRVPSTPVRVLAIQAIERLEVETLARDVDARITDNSDPVAAAAAVAVLRSSPGAPQIATQLLASDIPRARAIAVEGIGRKIGRSARTDLLFSLGDPDAEVRAVGATTIAAMKRAEDSAALVRMATGDPAVEVRVAALLGLSIGERGGALAAGIQAIAADAPEVRLAGIRLLRELGERDALVRVSADADLASSAPWLALHAELELATLDPGRARTSAPSWDALWQGATTHPSWRESAPIRVATARALGPGSGRQKAGPVDKERALAWLASLAADDDALVRVAAATARASLGQDEAMTQLAGACQGEHGAALEAAIRAHAENRRLSLGLVAALADESALARVHAAEAILTIVSGR